MACRHGVPPPKLGRGTRREPSENRTVPSENLTVIGPNRLEPRWRRWSFGFLRRKNSVQIHTIFTRPFCPTGLKSLSFVTRKALLRQAVAAAKETAKPKRR